MGGDVEEGVPRGGGSGLTHRRAAVGDAGTYSDTSTVVATFLPSRSS
jgi:hypothetical protein